MNQYTIFVNSSDGFEDCWKPFFYFFYKNWNGTIPKTFLNTSLKSFDNEQIISTKIELSELKKLTWSECLIKALLHVESEIVLYFQEDYFIDQPIDLSFVMLQVARMEKDKSIVRIGLTVNDYQGNLFPTEYDDLWEAKNNARYRVCTQASLWRRESLLSYLQPKESGWMFEIFGTWRSYRRPKDRFLTLNRNLFQANNQIISYIHTGVIKGKWHPSVIQLFGKNEINIDFYQRGFYDVNKSKWLSKLEVANKLIKDPLLFIHAILNNICK